MPRLILELEGSVSANGLEELDVTPAEIAVSNMTGRVYWPGLNEWDMNAEKTGFLDRFNDAPCMPMGAVNVSTAIKNHADGHPAYHITALTQALAVDGFDTSGSFTVAAVVGPEIGIGSITFGAGFWFVASLAGKIRYKIGNTERASYDSYTGPLLTDTKLTAVVFIYDRAAGQMILRVNGVQVDVLTAEELKTVVIKRELAFGRINAHLTASNVQGRFGAYRSCIAFNKAVKGSELVSLETMLMESIL